MPCSMNRQAPFALRLFYIGLGRCHIILNRLPASTTSRRLILPLRFHHSYVWLHEFDGRV